MEQPLEPIPPNIPHTSAQALFITPVETFSGRVVSGDALVTLSWRHGGPSRLGRSVFLRDEIDAGVVHALRWGQRGDLLATARVMAGAVDLDLVEDRAGGAELSANEAVALLSIDPSEVERLALAAALRGFTVSRIGWAAARSGVGRRAA